MMSKFLSRKFLMAIAAFLTAGFSGEPLAMAAVAAIYVLAEAHVDAKNVASNTTSVVKQERVVSG